MIDLGQLIATGVPPTQARQFLEPLRAAFERFHIDTRARMAAFIAQAAHESANFTRLEELLYYRTAERLIAVWPRRFAGLGDAAHFIRNPQALANRVYANRLGNGDEASGDGWRYRGRGIFQLTGRANYLAAGVSLGVDYKTSPEVVALPPDAAMTAGWYWATTRLNELADSSQIDEITQRINGPAMLGAVERRSNFDEALRAFA
jgi:putative chitinase